MLLVVISSLFTTEAQSLSQVVVANSGATISGASNTLSFTVGEPVIGTITNGESLHQGFWAGAVENVLLSTDDFSRNPQPTIFPNPVKEYLNLVFTETTGEDVEIDIFDVLGNRVLHREFINNAPNEMLDMANYSSGVYILNVMYSKTQKAKTFKIIKQ